MRRLGTVDRTAQGLVIVRVDDLPDVGDEAIDENLDPVGRVVDVFGPVESPYAAVSPIDDRRLPTLLGSKLYVR